MIQLGRVVTALVLVCLIFWRIRKLRFAWRDEYPVLFWLSVAVFSALLILFIWQILTGHNVNYA
jgi:hypothetical protein